MFPKKRDMLTTQDYDLCNTYDTERKLLLYCGIYPNEGKINKFLYYLSASYHISASVLITSSVIIFLALNIKNILSIVEAVLFLATQLAFLCKLLNVLIKKQKLNEIEQILSNPVFYRHSVEKRAITEKLVRFTKLFGVFYRSIVSVVCITYIIFPLLDEKQWTLPLSGWNPIKIDSRVKYATLFTFQWLSYFMSAYINSAIDIMIAMLITIATSQLEILKDNLSNSDYKQDAAKHEFAHNVVLHYEILRLINAIESTFSTATFIQFFASVVVICFAEFEMMILPPNSIQFLSVGMYFNAMTFQVAIYCWFGHNIIASSENINEAIYMSNWYESDSSMKKSIMIFMEKCKKPVVLTAGKFFPLSLVTFSNIMRSSYSYFAVLQRLYSAE